MSIREIVEICDTRFHRRPSHHSIKTVLASGPPPSIQMRRFPLWNDTSDPAQRRHNIVQLHAEGWSVASIAEYLAVSKHTVYTTLKHWVQEGVKGLDDKSHARKAPRKVTLEVANEIRKKQENPLVGEWRMHDAILQDGRYSPLDVLRGVLARTLPAPTLAHIFFATEFTRHLNRSGYIRFRRWRFYAEEGVER